MSQDRAGRKEEIAWVGQQHPMQGFCGRASDAVAPAAEQPNALVLELRRPIAVVRTRPRQAKVVRIGPPKMATPADMAGVE